MPYVSLHNHTCFSLLDGYQTVEELVSTVKFLGQTAVALTDHGTMRGTIMFYKECLRQNLRPIIGCEFYFCPTVDVRDKSFTHHLVLLAMNEEGYMNLKKLDSLAYGEEHFFFKPRIDWEDLSSHSEGLICLSACMASIVNTENGEYWFKKYKELFGDRFYAEIQPLNIPEQQEYNGKVISLARKYNVELVCTTDAHYSKKEDQPYHSLWVGSHGVSYHDNENYLWGEEELRSTTYLPNDVIEKCIKNTEFIAEKCMVTIELKGQHYPTYPTDDPEEKIREICRGNWKKLVPKGKYKEYAARFEEEIKDLKTVGYLNYLLVVWSVLDWCDKNNIPKGEGRGSAAGCLVSYLMGIHKIDPIKFGTEFFRFCNPFRITPCDIDVDISTLNRGKIIEQIKGMYGNVCKVQTIGYTKNPNKDDIGKASVQMAWQALANNYKDKLQWRAENKISFIKSLASQEDILTIDGELNEEEREELYDVVQHFNGRINKLGCHASAILVTPDDIENYAPIEGMSATNIVTGKKEYIRAVCYDFHDLEEMGCLKLDILGLGTLDVIDNTLKQVNENINLESIPMDDKKVYQAYANGDVLGCFQMDSQGMRGVAKDIHTSNFNDGSALVALFRPGPISSGMLQQYIDGKNGKAISYPCKEMEEITKDTYGVLVYQEQVMKIAMKMAGYNLGQADALRKIIGRKEVHKIKEAVNQFIGSCVSNGFSMKVAEEVAKQIEAAGLYCFNKSHAVSYFRLSYKTAYLKVHYPLQFMCSLLNSKSAHEDLLPYINEVKRMGIKILPPSYKVGNLLWQVEEDGIRVGLTYIKGVSRNITVVDSDSFAGIISNNNKKVVEGLVKSGALDYLGKTRGWMISHLESIQKRLDRKKQCEEKIAENMANLNNAEDEKCRNKYTRQLLSWKQKLKDIKEEEVAVTNYDETNGELEVLSFSFKELPKIRTGKCILVREFNDKKGGLMARVTFSILLSKHEESGLVFASNWKKKGKYGITIEVGKTYEYYIEKGIIKDVREC